MPKNDNAQSITFICRKSKQPAVALLGGNRTNGPYSIAPHKLQKRLNRSPAFTSIY